MPKMQKMLNINHSFPTHPDLEPDWSNFWRSESMFYQISIHQGSVPDRDSARCIVDIHRAILQGHILTNRDQESKPPFPEEGGSEFLQEMFPDAPIVKPNPPTPGCFVRMLVSNMVQPVFAPNSDSRRPSFYIPKKTTTMLIAGNVSAIHIASCFNRGWPVFRWPTGRSKMTLFAPTKICKPIPPDAVHAHNALHPFVERTTMARFGNN